MLRSNARFHDGSPVTASDVVEAFRRNYVAYPNGDALISKDTQITAVADTTVELKTPQPTGVFPNALTSSNFIIHKPSTPGGTDATILTGPYRATSLAVDDQMMLEPFADHWAGVPPEVVGGLGTDFTVASIPSGIADSVEINLTRQPLSDHASTVSSNPRRTAASSVTSMPAQRRGGAQRSRRATLLRYAVPRRNRFKTHRPPLLYQ